MRNEQKQNRPEIERGAPITPFALITLILHLRKILELIFILLFGL